MGEQRRYRRVKLNASLSYQLEQALSDPHRHPGILTDINAGGFRFAGSHPITPGTRLHAQLRLPNRPEPYRLNGEVVWLRPSHGVTEYGVAFVDVSPEQQADIDELVQFLLKPLTPS